MKFYNQILSVIKKFERKIEKKISSVEEIAYFKFKSHS